MIPKGMALKLVLLSSKVVEKIPEKKYENYNFKIKISEFKLTLQQKESNKSLQKFVFW